MTTRHHDNMSRHHDNTSRHHDNTSRAPFHLGDRTVVFLVPGAVCGRAEPFTAVLAIVQLQLHVHALHVHFQVPYC